MSETQSNADSLISYHAFLLPFRWDCASRWYKKKDTPNLFDINSDYKKRLNVDTFHKTLCQNFKWTYLPFKINLAEHYNEYVYFYPHTQQAVFNTNKEFKIGSASYCFSYNDNACKFYNIYIKNGRNYSLSVDSITLTIYETGIGILKFGLENHRYTKLDDILIINDFGRRIYPQFLGPFQGPEDSQGIEETRNNIYPNLTEISHRAASDIPKKCEIESTYYNDETNLNLSENQTVQILPEFIKTLLGDRFKTQLTDIKSKDILLTPIIDDRMFVMCVFGDRNGIFDYRTERAKGLSDGRWIQFLFMDGHGKGAANKSFERELINRHSYDRWLEYGTRYGISRYSFVARLQGTLDSGFPKTALTHCKTMYLRSIFLSLTQRASIIRFSEEIAHISSSNDQDTDKIRDLYKNYIRFVNKFHFNEVTAQEQGIEIYTMIQDHMRNKENLTALREEISDLHAFADLISEKKRGKAADRLNWIVAFFLVPTLITGYFGMNIFEKSNFVHKVIIYKWIPLQPEISLFHIAAYIPLIFFALIFIYISKALLSCIFSIFTKSIIFCIHAVKFSVNTATMKIYNLFKNTLKKGKA